MWKEMGKEINSNHSTLQHNNLKNLVKQMVSRRGLQGTILNARF